MVESSSKNKKSSTPVTSTHTDEFSEISDLKLTELSESNRLVKSLMSAISVGVYIVQDGKFVYVSPMFETYTGYTKKDVLGTYSLDYVHEDDRESVKNNAIANLKGIQEVVYEYRFIKKDKTIIWISEKTISIMYHDRPATLASFIDSTKRRNAEMALRESEGFTSSVLENSPNPIFVLNADKSIKYANHAMEELTGFTAKEVIGIKAPFPWWGGENTTGMIKVFDQSGPRTIGKRTEHFHKKNGDDFWVEITFVNVENKYYLSNWIDITERKKAEEELQESEEKFRKLFNSTSDMLFLFEVDAKGMPLNIIEVNDVICQKLGYTRDELLKMSRKDISTPESWEELVKNIMPTVRKYIETSFETTMLCKDGTKIIAENSPHMFKWKGKRVVLTIARDISERKKWEDELLYMATHDPLTGLPNRALLNDRLEMALAQVKRKKQELALMVMDLDKFKIVNDQLGHLVGDRLLKGVAERLTGLLRKSDTVARIGGDEFVILLPDVLSLESVTNVAEKILALFNTPFILDGNEVNISTSIGIATYPKSGRDSITLIRNADVAMYKAKETGRNTFIFAKNK